MKRKDANFDEQVQMNRMSIESKYLQPTIWTLLPSTRGPLPLDNEPQPSVTRPPGTPCKKNEKQASL